MVLTPLSPALTYPQRQLDGRDEVARRVSVFPDPPPRFDARPPRAEEIAAYGLPPRPGPGAPPAVVRLWDRLLAPPYERVAPLFDVDPTTVHAGPGRHPASNSGALGTVGASRWGSSRNWAGAVIRTRGTERFASVAARWRIPVPALPKDAKASAPPPQGSWRASVWTGLDGDRRSSLSMPQLGTTSVMGPTGPRAYLWAQWWVRDRPYGECVLTSLPVQPGDEVVCWLTVADPEDVWFHVRTFGANLFTTFRWKAGEVAAQDPGSKQVLDRRTAPVEGLAAEWVVERPMTLPTDPDPMTLYPLPRFGEAMFEDPVAAATASGTMAAGGTGDPWSTGGTARDLTACRLLRMTAAEATPPGVRIVATPTAAPAPAGPLVVRGPD